MTNLFHEFFNRSPHNLRIRKISFIILLMIGGTSVIAEINSEVKQPVRLESLNYVQSATCIRCHPNHYDSWSRTYHRTMTQTAGHTSVLGNFNNVTYFYNGVVSRFHREGETYFIETIDSEGQIRDFPIAYTVGSRRIQQYITKIGDRYIRLPLAWDIEEGRWFHLNGGFLDPDGTGFNKHLSLWDGNCIFCHNVKASPGYDFKTQTFNSKVAELGIACESCHGPGQEHISRNTNPLRRYFLYYSSHSDKTIVHPAKMPKQQQLQICGHCHGQRKPNPPERISEFFSVGDPFTAGSDLNQYTTPLWSNSDLPGVNISLRFWKDGTPRLTAYEYQGILQSHDYQKGNLTCLSCHNMHGGDVKGMINPEMRGNSACFTCHSKFQNNITAHTKHGAESSGSNCYNCHMPKITYGILNIHRSHRIQNPDPSRAWRYQMPEACTICHSNRSAVWAANQFKQLYNQPLPVDLSAEPQYQVAEDLRALFSGDVVQRAVAISALGSDQSYTADPDAQLWAVPFLIMAMEDNYPAIRHFAYRSLRSLVERYSQKHAAITGNRAQLTFFDPQSPAEKRLQIIREWKNWWEQLDKRYLTHPGSEVPLDDNFQLITAKIERLMANRDQSEISIGE
jgi:predicted CXXCH cytochrome family protein